MKEIKKRDEKNPDNINNICANNYPLKSTANCNLIPARNEIENKN